MLDLGTEEVSGHSEKGQHTTTYAEMFELKRAGAPSRAPSLEPMQKRSRARGSRLAADELPPSSSTPQA